MDLLTNSSPERDVSDEDDDDDEEEEEDEDDDWMEMEDEEVSDTQTASLSGKRVEVRVDLERPKDSARTQETDETTSVTEIESSDVIWAPGKTSKTESEGSTPRKKRRKARSIYVKFVLPNNEEYVEEFKDSMTVIELKCFLGLLFRVNRQELLLFWRDHELFDLMRLHELPIDPGRQIASLKLHSTDLGVESHLRNVGRTRVQRVTIRTIDGTVKVEEIVVESKCICKPFLGGFRDKKGGEFHHASCQTKPFSVKETSADLVERDVQTVKLRSREMSTVSEKATQMFRDDHFISCEHDVVKTPGQYVTAAEMERRRDLLRHVRTIQRYWRAWLIWRAVKRAAAKRRQQLAWEAEAAGKKDREKDTRLKHDIVVKAFPRTRGDFEMLYQMVEDWRKSEINAIKKTDMCEAAKKARYFDVLQKEIELLRNVERHRLMVKDEYLQKKEVEIISKCSKPITWTGYKGLTISMDTLRTQRARELTEIYQSLTKEDVSVERRLDLLMHLKKAMEPYTYKEVDDVIELINRECDLLVRSLSGEELDILRKRFKQLFLKILMMPIFNPETAKYSMEYSNLGLEFEMFRCTRCDKLLPRSKFYPSTKSRRLETCLHCAWLENIAIPRTDLGPYRYMLRAVRRDERRRGSYSSVAFVMQDEDLRHLVANIWHGRSAISQKETLSALRMARWDVRRDWAPWNCILLTEDEARAHVRIEHFDDTYEAVFKAEVHNKHLLAKNHFHGLANVDKYLRESCEWTKVQDTKSYHPPSPKVELVQDVSSRFLATSVKNLLLAFPSFLIPAVINVQGPLTLDDYETSWIGPETWEPSATCWASPRPRASWTSSRPSASRGSSGSSASSSCTALCWRRRDSASRRGAPTICNNLTLSHKQ